ncbi:hypothetical protein BDZ45DRAFT_747984 [Acephala macrosclerotiorum]|nr:hypothetical protein BDZ45DRAFT_747984 [Acephala macrosclerotiorum]
MAVSVRKSTSSSLFILSEWKTNVCTPELSIPSFVTSIIPTWSGSAANFYGVFNLPFALTSQSGLTLPKSRSVKQTSSSTPATSTSTQSAQPNMLPHLPGSIQTGSSETPSPTLLPTGASTTPLPPGGITAIMIPPSIIVNGRTITANPQGSFIIGTTTAIFNADGNLMIGDHTIPVGAQAAIVSREIISLAARATGIIYGGASTTRLGSIIMSFLDGGSTTPNHGDSDGDKCYAGTVYR